MEDRKRRVLQAIIDDYIHTAEPVGSRTVARKYGLGVSPATIRNEMADLEDMGYLEQPHTSAGRVPSDKGYRFYVDVLAAEPGLGGFDSEAVRAALSARALQCTCAPALRENPSSGVHEPMASVCFRCSSAAFQMIRPLPGTVRTK